LSGGAAGHPPSGAGSDIAYRIVCPRSETVKIKSAVFEMSAPDLAACPTWALPEFAFIGRSNVGKSSLINMLTERRDLAKVSVTPGKTQLINFFVINDRWSLVDLPGYGYAAVGHRDRDAFNAAVAEYLEQRKNIRCVFVLIDSRLPPQPIDLQFVNWLEECGVPYVLAFTKTDKQSDTRTRANIDLFTQGFGAEGRELPPVFTSSGKTKSGRAELLRFIEDTLAGANRG
jgi:GTP-binding protein